MTKWPGSREARVINWPLLAVTASACGDYASPDNWRASFFVCLSAGFLVTDISCMG